jgi:hypothetical protein
VSETLSDLEKTALATLLAGDHPALATLRRQLERTRVRGREQHECGQFTDLWVEDDAEALDVAHRFAIDDVYGSVDGLQEETALLLHVVRGRLKTLEAFVVEGPWPERPRLTRTWYVVPHTEDAGQLRPVEARNLDHAVRGLTADADLD